MVDTVNRNQIEKLPKPDQLKTLSSLSEGHKCQHCDLVFESSCDLATHSLFQEKKFFCTLCPVKFQTLKGMKQHFGKKHAKSRPYRCSICLKRFRNVYACRIHRLQVHMHTAQQQCSFCNKVVYNKYSLTRHLGICAKKP